MKSLNEFDSMPRYSAPSFCRDCGKPYPWTETVLSTAGEYIDGLDNVTEDEKRLAKADLQEVIRQTPKAVPARKRFREFATKAGKRVTEALRDIFVDVASETIKKTL